MSDKRYRMAVGSDDAGVHLKDYIRDRLRQDPRVVEGRDFGVADTADKTPYSVVCIKVAETVARGEFGRAVLFGGTGLGEARGGARGRRMARGRPWRAGLLRADLDLDRPAGGGQAGHAPDPGRAAPAPARRHPHRRAGAELHRDLPLRCGRAVPRRRRRGQAGPADRHPGRAAARAHARLVAPEGERTARIQTHCHQHAVLGFSADRELLADAGVEADVLDSGCCGLAGNFGFEKGHYEVSEACAERVLLPAVRGAGAGDVIPADGFSCRMQIEQGNAGGRQAVHLAELLRAGLHGDGRAWPERRWAPRPEPPSRLARAAVLAGTGGGLAAAAAVTAAVLRRVTGRA